MGDDGELWALEQERDRYAARGLTDRVAQVDAELARRRGAGQPDDPKVERAVKRAPERRGKGQA